MNNSQYEIHKLNSEQRNAFLNQLNSSISLANSLKNLTSNPDFIAVFGDERVNKEIRRLNTLLKNTQDPQRRQSVVESLLFFSHFDANCAYIMAEGEKASYARNEVHEIWSQVDNGSFDADTYFADDTVHTEL